MEIETSFNLSSFLERAENAFKTRKFIISINHYYNILSRGKSIISNDDDFKKILTCFAFNIIFLSASQQKEKFLNFALRNDSFLLISNDLMKILTDMSKRKLIFEKDSNLTENAPEIVIEVTKNSDLLQMSFLEHNIFSLSTVYTSISFDSLDKFLRISNAETLIFKLIIEERVRAKIDQKSKILLFVTDENLLQFDKQVKNFCNKLIAINSEF